MLSRKRLRGKGPASRAFCNGRELQNALMEAQSRSGIDVDVSAILAEVVEDGVIDCRDFAGITPDIVQSVWRAFPALPTAFCEQFLFVCEQWDRDPPRPDQTRRTLPASMSNDCRVEGRTGVFFRAAPPLLPPFPHRGRGFAPVVALRRLTALGRAAGGPRARGPAV